MDGRCGTGLQTTDPGPGQTLQDTLTGAVVVSYCVWSALAGKCVMPPEEYVEWGQAQVTVQPLPVPSRYAMPPATVVVHEPDHANHVMPARQA